MTVAGRNGTSGALEFEVTHSSPPYAGAREDELELHEWETPELAHESEGEWEREQPKASHFSNPYAATEDEWEAPETHPYSNPYIAQELHEDEWETPEIHEFYPPQFGRRSLIRTARRLVPLARATMPGVVRIIIRVPIGRLMRQFAPLLREGEQEAAEFEAQLFGQNEAQAEVAGHEAAHEAALTEVLAAEAAHTESEHEAAALLGAALPITIRIMGAGRAVWPVTPTLLRANARLVRGLHRGGASRRQLVRVVPAVHRRVAGSLRAAAHSGRPITPRLAASVMAAQTARVLGTPRLTGGGLVRNAIIRQSTVAPSGRSVHRACRGCK